MLVDSHCHLTAGAFEEDRAEILDRATAAGVGHIVVIGESPAAAAAALELAATHSWISATAGLHPHDARLWNPETDAWLREVLQDGRIVAAGEMGLDYHYDHSPRDVQRQVFDRQLEIAAEAGRPAVIHAREADADVSAVLRAHPEAVAILHSFSSGPDLLDTALDLNHYISFSGMITFRSWKDDAALTRPPLDRLLVETDAPYLAPVPHRGGRNEPAYVARVAERLAEARGVSTEEMVRITGKNAKRVFGERLTAS
ncbi:MAG: TatD family hydrolase [Gemmatimonadales bacterium]